MISDAWFMSLKIFYIFLIIGSKIFGKILFLFNSISHFELQKYGFIDKSNYL